MKKIIMIIICLGITAAIFTNNITVKSKDSNIQGNENIQVALENKLIRFHVIANSDNAYDQALKLKVRDKVLQFITPMLKDSKNIEESRNIIKQNDNRIQEIAQQTVKENGYSYNVVTMLSKEKFPVKTYGNITLPQGEYEAYRILIGSGKGQNWWCVMFPPLCFIDITKGDVAYNETESSMKRVLTDKEYDAVDNTKTSKEDTSKKSSTGKEKVEIRFKIFDEIKTLINKL